MEARAVPTKTTKRQRRLSRKGRILKGWRRGGRIGVKSHEIASQKLRLRANFERRVNHDFACEFGCCNSNGRADTEP
jgi:hypothetical protein